MISDFMKGGSTMLSTTKTNQNIVYVNHKSSGLSSSCTESTVLPNAASNITKGQVFIVSPSLKSDKPVSKTK